MPLKAQRFYPLLVIAAGLLAYQNSFTGSFYHDDFQTILDNPTIRHLWPIGPVLAPFRRSTSTVAGRPFINLTLAVNYAISGYNVWSYHVVNLVVHILAGLTLFGIVRRTFLQARLRERFGVAASELALATAVLWTVHPLQTESVTYIVQRAESIMGLFYLLTLYCFIRGVESVPVQRPVGTQCSASQWPRGSAALPSALWFTLSVVACALGMASKQVMVSTPLIVMLYDRAFLSGSFRQAWRQRWPVYLALSATWVVLAVTMVSAGFYDTVSKLNESHHLNRWTYLLTQSEVIVRYLRCSVWPFQLPILVNTFQPGSVILPGATVLLLLGASAWALGKNSPWGFIGAWFFIILAPTSSFLPSIDPIFLHRMYLPLAAVVIAVVMGLYTVLGRLSLTVFVVMAIGLGVLTWCYNQSYRKNPHFNSGLILSRTGRFQESIVEYEQALRITPNDPWLHNNLGGNFMMLGRHQDAIDHYEQALRLRPDLADAHYNLGKVLERVGGVPEAIAHWEAALRINPYYPNIHNNLGNALLKMGGTSEAIGHYEQVLRTEPDDASTHNNLGVALSRAGRVQEAIRHYEQALRLKPDYAEAHCNLAILLQGNGRVQEAIGHYEQALQLKPDWAQAHSNLGSAMVQLGRVQDAIGHYEEAVRIEPNDASAHNNLGSALLQAGNVTDAIEQYEHALLLNPNMAGTHFNLGLALEQLGRVPEAIGHYEEAARIEPDHIKAKQALMRLQAVP